MVEFGMTFAFFIFVVLGCINLILVAYNFSTAYRATWEAARRGAVGGTNSEIAEIIDREFVQRYYGSMMLISEVTVDPSRIIVPNNIADRIEGREVEINLTYRTGFSLGILGDAIRDVPITTRLAIVAQNNDDRDNFHDSFDAFPNDHDNDGMQDNVDQDDDNDGTADVIDTRAVYHFGASYRMYDRNGVVSWMPAPVGKFAARAIFYKTDGDTEVEPWPLKPRRVPRDLYSANGTAFITTTIDTRYDADNDGWEDIWDASPNNAAAH